MPRSTFTVRAISTTLEPKCTWVALSVLLALVTASSGQATQHKADNSTKEQPAAPCNGDSLKVDGIQPLFLDARDAEQTMHLVGCFPEGTVVPVNENDAFSIKKYLRLSPQDFLVSATLSDRSPGSRLLTLTTGNSHVVPVTVQVDVVGVTAACSKALAAKNAMDGASNIAGCSDAAKTANSAGSPTAPAVSASCQLPKDGTYAAFNAVTREFTDNGTTAFCNRSSRSGDPSSFNPKSIYKTEKETVHFVVCNKNPFIANTSPSITKTPIENDDLTMFLGVLAPGLGAAKAASDATSSAKNNSSASKGLTARQAPLPPSPEAAPLPSFPPIADAVQDCLDGIAAELRGIDDEYGKFRRCFQAKRKNLLQSDLTCDARLKDTVDLSTAVAALNSRASDETADVNEQLSAVQAIVTTRGQIANNGAYSKDPLTQQQVTALQSANQALTSEGCVSDAASTLVNTVYTAASWLDTMLGDSQTFIEQTDIRVSGPTTVNWSVMSAPPTSNTANILSAGGALSSDPYAKCRNQTQPGGNTHNPSNGNGRGTGGNNGGTANPPASPNNSSAPVTGESDVLYSMAPRYHVQNVALSVRSHQESPKTGQDSDSGGAAADNKTSKSSSNSGNPPATGAPTGAEVGSGTYVFGAPQVVVSIGVAGVFMQNRQYQKVQASGQTSGTTIEYSTDSSARISPLIMAHGRIHKFARTDDAIWGTLGVTASSNNSGVSPEYFVGGTVSFLHNWVFLTPGLYVSQKETLTGGYKVGQQLPSSFSGSLPIQQSYKPAFGFAISFRVPGTSAPKSKTTNQNNGSGSNGTKNGGSGSKGAGAQ
jgi:hypothetical protein